jgi:NAD(P)H-flavin reductase
MCIAAGTSPNTMYEKEYTGTFTLDDRKSYFKNYNAVRGADGRVTVEPSADGFGFFTSYNKDGKTISYYGDNHPRYAGSVVKAMASGKDGYQHVSRLFDLANLDPNKQAERNAAWKAFAANVHDNVSATVVRVERLTPTIVDVVVRAPLAAKKFEPGQFYRLQNFESVAQDIDGTPLVMEGLALTGAWVDKDKGLLSMIVLEMGASSRMCARLKPGEQVVVMGPTGTPTEIPHNENVVLVGGGLGNAVLFSIAAALKKNGCKVIYIAGYRKGEDLFKQEEIERSTDQVVWCSDTGVEIKARREQDRYYRGNIVQGMAKLALGEIGTPIFKFDTAKRFIVIGSDRMMAAVARARHEVLQKHCSKDHVAIGSINSPMQCMMKEICAQCLQRHVDPVTGKETFVFSCYNQDQELDHVDWSHLNGRLRQNSVQEKQTNLWFDHLLAVESSQA